MSGEKLPYANFQEANEMGRFLKRLVAADDLMAGEEDDDEPYHALVEEIAAWVKGRKWLEELEVPSDER